MATQDTNLTRIGIIEESVFGTTPATPAFQILRTTGNPGLGYATRTEVSKEIRSDRNVTDLILVGADAAGNYNFELSFGAIDVPIEGALFSDWAVKPTVVNTAANTPITAVVAADDQYTAASGMDVFKATHLVYASGFTNSGNNGLKHANGVAAGYVGVNESLTEEEDPPTGCRLRAVGFHGAATEIAATASGLGRGASGAFDFSVFGLVAGEWLYVGGTATGKYFATAACSGWCRISAVAATAITFDIVPTGWTTDAGTDKTIEVYFGDYLRNGTTKKTYAIERYFPSLSAPVWQYFNGMMVDKFSLSIAAEAVVKGSFSFVGKTSTMLTAVFSGGTTLAAPTNDVLNAVSNVGSIKEGGTDISVNYVKEFTLELSNNARSDTRIGALEKMGIGAGKCNISGTVNSFFESTALVAKVLANTETSYQLALKRDYQCFHIDLPAVKFSSGSPEVAEEDQTVMTPLAYQAFMHATLGYSIQIQQFHYCPALT